MADLTVDELKARRAAREAKLDELAEKLELEELKLEDEYSDKLGQRGVDFDIVVTAKGCIVVKKPDWTVAKRFNSAADKSDEDVVQFAAPCVVFPAPELFRALVTEHGGIAWKCAGALMAMYEAKFQARAKK